MNRFFADTFYYVALVSPADEAHENAVRVTRSLEVPIVTTEWVLTEVADGMASSRSRAAMIEFIDGLRADPDVRIIPARQALLIRGWELFSRRRDKEWSLTDCISFVVMRELKLTDALTADRHFEQAGFRLLL